MSTDRLQWNSATRVKEPEGMQLILQRPILVYGPANSDHRMQLVLHMLSECRKYGVVERMSSYKTIAGLQELETRLERHFNGTLEYKCMASKRLISIATARDIGVPYEFADIGPNRGQLIQLLQDSDAAAGPFRLLELPAELRAEIFSYVVLAEYRTSSSPGPVLPNFPPLLFINRQVRKEAGEIFMKSRPMVLPCTINGHRTRASSLRSTDVKISARKEALEWLRMAGVDLLPRISACLMVHLAPDWLYRSFVYNIDPLEGTCVYNINRLGKAKGWPLLDRRGVDLLDLDSPIGGQFDIKTKDAHNIKLNEAKAARIATSFQSWKEQSQEDRRRSKFHGAAILLNWP